MIQFNLLPDVKLEYIRAQRKKRTIISLSILVAGVSLAIFVLSFMAVNVAQKRHLSNLQKDIDISKKTLQDKKDLSKIVTIQNQLNSLPNIHAQKPVASRVFSFIQQVTPANASVSSMKINFADQTITIEGAADNLVTVNTFADTLKFTSYSATQASTETEGSEAQTAPAFNSVVLDTFSVVSTGVVSDSGKTTTFGLKLKFDPLIFSADKTINLVVASQVTTRSETEKPDAIFQTNKVDTEGAQ